MIYTQTKISIISIIQVKKPEKQKKIPQQRKIQVPVHI